MKETYCQKVARETAEKLLKSDQITLAIVDWGDGNTLFVSRDDTEIYATGVINIDGTTLYIGTRRKD